MRNFQPMALALALISPAAAFGQDETERADGSLEIDILTRPASEGEIDPRLVEECEQQVDAAQISGEIVVCRQLREKTDNSYYGDQNAAESNYAAETAWRDSPATPNPCGPNCGIFKGPPTVGGLCIPFLKKCPPPPALFVDVAALPKPPPGSDADRIAHGLPPLGNDGETETGTDGTPGAINQEELGLPPLPGQRQESDPPNRGENRSIAQ